MRRSPAGVCNGALLAVLLLLPHAVAAQPARAAEPYNTVELQAEANREIPNDTLNASLYAETSDADAARVADALNRISNEALKAAGGFKAVRARSGGNSTYPVYDRNQRLTGWRGRAEIRLESRDFPAASALIAKLQSGMQLSSLSFNVSRELQTNTENELIAEAVKAFRGRADIARQALGGKSYRLRRIAINTSGSSPPRPMLRMSAAAVSAEVSAPQFEGGLSTVTVSVSGTVEVE